MGAHWPSDVLAGTLIATAWLTFVVSVRWISDREFAIKAKPAAQPACPAAPGARRVAASRDLLATASLFEHPGAERADADPHYSADRSVAGEVNAEMHPGDGDRGR